MASASPTPLNPNGNVLPIMIHVTAPATLPGGYTFEAAINGDESKIVNVEVVRRHHRPRCVPRVVIVSQCCSRKEVSKKDRYS